MRILLFLLAFLALPATAEVVTTASGGVLRALDKISGDTVDIEIPAGGKAGVGSLEIVLVECRYPAGNPSGNAYAALEISETGRAGTLFSGWMIASAPALSAMEHPRYDVWVIRCITS
ncbi:MAG: DUF2155 domain-containing protein [Sulfitobacter sp.]|nr:DUF2155 domain-containing protein [Sulfitobacter sp.]